MLSICSASWELVVKIKDKEFGSQHVDGLDFFGNRQKSEGSERSPNDKVKHSLLKKKEVEPFKSELTRKRNREQHELEKKGKKKRKSQGMVIDSSGKEAESYGILWMSSLEAKLKDTGNLREKKLTAEKMEQRRQEKVNYFRKKHKIYVQGTDIPEPVATFEQLGKEYNIHPRIMQNIQESGFRLPTPIQMQAVPVMLHGREILACAPTGSGKTLAFSIPILMHLKQPMNKGFRALIVSPTRELASQTQRELVKLSEGTGFRIHMIHKAAEAAKKFGRKSAKRFDILVTTPNRLVYLLKQDPSIIDLSSVEWLVVDESDKLFEDGKTGFREQLASIFLACTSHIVKRAMFSATFAHDVENWCKLHLDNVISVSVGARNSAVETVEQELLFVGSETGKLLAMRDLIKKGFLPPVLVFVQSVDRAKELFHELIYEGINVDIIHADRTQQQRDSVIQNFRAGKIWVLICTALLARGIDFKGVNMVINFDFPTSSVEYIHRIGRTGRAGHKGKAISFFTEDDKPLIRSIANVIQQAGCPVPDYIKHFRKLQTKQKKRMIKNPLKREQIRTTPQYFLEQAKRRNKMNQENHKKKKNTKDLPNTDQPQMQSSTES
ncbi:putative ATP-dependent RNA helicase DDX52 isoform X3 [Microcaecilia unicolor]|uniref:Probable ATP-dependent RNA helicase DDX52 n=1 Tax=Microcaecilia unicolor TaxID=1415580 RepID=A0A6P7WE97_9AMPH|nr:probable ATP-dependent RNA helicase DDX52 isoform X3 [Microcaecilia unicolor]